MADSPQNGRRRPAGELGDVKKSTTTDTSIIAPAAVNSFPLTAAEPPTARTEVAR